MKKVGVLIVTYNRLQLLKEEIVSIREQSYKEYDIIVVNNSSTDGTIKWLESQNDIITITQPNSGGAGGFYTGMKYIAEHGYQYCWLMDDDIECEKTALQQLMSIAEKEHELGFLCSRVVGINGRPMNVPTIETRELDENYPSWLERVDDGLIKVRTATFVSVLIPTSNIIKFGLPIKEYFIWGDDTEYTNRLSDELPSYLVFSSKVVHKRVISQRLNFLTETNPNRLNNYFYALRNSFMNSQKYGNTKERFLNIAYLMYLFPKLLLRFDMKRLKILLRAYCSLFVFKPTIEFPEVGK